MTVNNANDHLLEDLPRGRLSKIPQDVLKYLTRSEMLRTAARYPQAVLRITSFGKKIARIKAHLSYISRHGELSLEDQDGNSITTLEEQKELLASWEPNFDTHKNSRHTMHFIVSVPRRNDRVLARNAASQFLKQEFSNHDYVFVAHADTRNPHVHVVLNLKNERGKKLDPRKAYLHRLRQSFAAVCREQGIQVTASPRKARGLVKYWINQACYQMKNKRNVTPNVAKQSENRLDFSYYLTCDVKYVQAIQAARLDLQRFYFKVAQEYWEKAEYAKTVSETTLFNKTATLLVHYAKDIVKEVKRENSIEHDIS